jgi:predicted peptidase
MERHTYNELPYRLARPPVVEAGTQYPLVVFLHGAGERGTDNERQLTHGVPQFLTTENRAKYPCFLIAPQCPAGQRWVEVDWGSESHVQPQEPSAPARLTLELIDRTMGELPIDPDRVYVTGLSMGGFGAWDLLARRPDLFAAATIF